MKIKPITNPQEKSEIAEQILRALPDWFGIEESLLEYVSSVADKLFFAAFENGKPIGFFAGQIHYEHTGEIYVCGILPDYHRQGTGSQLYQALENEFLKQNCQYVVVKTLSAQRENAAYAQSRQFYRKIGFTELLDLPELWGKPNVCLLMIKKLGEEK